MTDKILGSLFAIFMFVVVILWATFIVNIVERLHSIYEHKQDSEGSKAAIRKIETKKPRNTKDYLA